MNHDKAPYADDWELIIYHESGHAAMALHLWKESADMCLSNKLDTNGKLIKSAKYKIRTGIKAYIPGEPPPLKKRGIEQVMIHVAGAMVERIKYGRESEGCQSDLNKAKNFIAHHNENDALNEIAYGFPESFKRTTEIMGLVNLIADAALAALAVKKPTEESFDEMLLLDGNSVYALYESFMKNE